MISVFCLLLFHFKRSEELLHNLLFLRVFLMKYQAGLDPDLFVEFVLFRSVVIFILIRSSLINLYKFYLFLFGTGKLYRDSFTINGKLHIILFSGSIRVFGENISAGVF